jgi:hypothetical protein
MWGKKWKSKDEQHTDLIKNGKSRNKSTIPKILVTRQAGIKALFQRSL